MELSKEELVEIQISDLIDYISEYNIGKYKKECLTEIIKNVLMITSDECCDRCQHCCEWNGCKLDGILSGLNNIYGNELVADDC